VRGGEAFIMSLKIVRNTSRKLKSTVMFVASFALALGSVSFAAPQFFSQAAHATSATVCETSCTADTIQAAIDAASAGETITFGGNASIGHQLTINKEITIDGAGKTISPTFAYYDNDNNASIGIIGAANVTINNLIVDGISGTSLHGINVFESDECKLKLRYSKE